MSIWTRITDALAALVARGEGLLAVFDRRAPEGSVAFTIAILSLGAKMAKADGLVRVAEVAAFREVFQIARKDEAAAARVFDLARQDIAGYEAYAARIGAMFRDRPHVLEDILEGLFHVALADGRYHEGEEDFLNEVARRFGVAPEAFDAIEARHLEGRRQDPWAVLGLPRDADLATAREALARSGAHPPPRPDDRPRPPPRDRQPRQRPPRPDQPRLGGGLRPPARLRRRVGRLSRESAGLGGPEGPRSAAA